MPEFPISKIVSGGQSGVDRAALDVAIFLEIDHGGWCPAGRRSENGPIPTTYQLRETIERDYSVRTQRNVIDSDGTLILFYERLSGGTELTLRLALKHGRSHLCLDLSKPAERANQSEALRRWISEHNISVMNVAGPRESSSPGIGQLAESFLVSALSMVATRNGVDFDG